MDYPNIDLLDYFYGMHDTNVHVNWKVNPFFNRHLQKRLPHWRVLCPLMKKLRRQLSTQSMLILGQSLIDTGDFEEATRKQLKEYPRKKVLIFVLSLLLSLSFPHRRLRESVIHLTNYFWRRLDGFTQAQTMLKELPARRAYTKALQQLLMRQLGDHPKAEELARSFAVAQIGWNPSIDASLMVDLMAVFCGAKAFAVEWDQDDEQLDIIQAHWCEAICKAIHEHTNPQ